MIDSIFHVCLHLPDCLSLSQTSSCFRDIVLSIFQMETFWIKKIQLLLSTFGRCAMPWGEQALELDPSLSQDLASWRQAYFALVHKKPASCLLACKIHQVYLEPKFNVCSLLRTSLEGRLDVAEYMLDQALLMPSAQEQIDMMIELAYKSSAELHSAVFSLDPRFKAPEEVRVGVLHTLPVLFDRHNVTENDCFLFKLACQEGYIDVVKLFLSRKRYTETDLRISLEHAQRRGQTEVIKLLTSI